jgi:hypothetical protein
MPGVHCQQWLAKIQSWLIYVPRFVFGTYDWLNFFEQHRLITCIVKWLNVNMVIVILDTLMSDFMLRGSDFQIVHIRLFIQFAFFALYYYSVIAYYKQQHGIQVGVVVDSADMMLFILVACILIANYHAVMFHNAKRAQIFWKTVQELQNDPARQALTLKLFEENAFTFVEAHTATVVSLVQYRFLCRNFKSLFDLDSQLKEKVDKRFLEMPFRCQFTFGVGYALLNVLH